ncbi:hypothetical protein QJS04_geneDACA014495 [Acorus gramineus]|uniref:C2H2-type domain-containing protein n=1 Tax=Acorus gramineus TaxID=55184 RepID=A0AAV9AP36_ACOGR|nr:hypothetical protein QJS04_geneDACA014495 [Acorus gramineus]
MRATQPTPSKPPPSALTNPYRPSPLNPNLPSQPPNLMSSPPLNIRPSGFTFVPNPPVLTDPSPVRFDLNLNLPPLQETPPPAVVPEELSLLISQLANASCDTEAMFRPPTMFFRCEVCDLVFYTARSLGGHRRVHTRSKRPRPTIKGRINDDNNNNNNNNVVVPMPVMLRPPPILAREIGGSSSPMGNEHGLKRVRHVLQKVREAVPGNEGGGLSGVQWTVEMTPTRNLRFGGGGGGGGGGGRSPCEGVIGRSGVTANPYPMRRRDESGYDSEESVDSNFEAGV